MNNHVIWVVEGTIDPTKKDEYISLMKEMLVNVEKEEGTLVYEWTISEDNKTIAVYERYKDEASANKHCVESFAPFAERFLSLVTVTKFPVYSKIYSEELKGNIAGLNPVYMTPIGGFARF